MAVLSIWTLDPFVFRPTSSGLSVHSLASEALINFVSLAGGINSVWADEQYVYLGTALSGIHRCPFSTISGATTTTPYKIYPDITNNSVNYVHGNGDYLCATTISGVDSYKISTGDRESTLIVNPYKCYQMLSGDYYYCVNPIFKPIGLDSNLLDWTYVREVDIEWPIPHDNYQFLLEIPLTEPDYILSQAAAGGVDIRILDGDGVRCPHFIERWTETDPPLIFVNLSKDVDKLYILYGNREVSDLSEGDATFRLFDHFDVGPELDSEKWEFVDGGYVDHVYTIEDSILKFTSWHNSYDIGIRSVTSFSGGIIEQYSRRTINSNNDDIDFRTQFDTDGTGGYVGISEITGEYPHYLDSKSDQGVVYGTKFVSTSFKLWRITESLNYQASNYDDELLVSSGTLNVSAYRPIYIYYNSWYNRPDIEIDWVRVRSYDPNPPGHAVSRGQYVEETLGVSKLYAAYSSGGGGFTYESALNSPLRANYINDMYVTENTSKHGGNVIFLGTSWGMNIIEEKRGDELNADKRILLIYS